MLTLTIAEIMELAASAGLVLKEGCEPDDDELETEIVIMACPAKGVRGDDGKVTHHAHVAYFAEYPDEGCMPLGPELTPPNAGIQGRAGLYRHVPCNDGLAGYPLRRPAELKGIV